MVWGSLSDITFSDAKQLLVGCRGQLRKKDIEFDSKVSHSFKSAKWNLKKFIVVLKSKKCCFLGKSTKMSNLILCSRKFLKFYLCPRKAGGLFILVWKSCPSEAVPSLRLLLSKCVKDKHIENRQDQRCLPFSTRSPF